MKTKLTVFILGLIFTAGLSQEHKISIPNIGEYQLKIDGIYATVEIEGHNSSDLVIKAEGYTQPPKKAEGMNVVRRYGIENTSIGLVVNEIDNMIIVSAGSKNNKDLSYKILVPNNVSVTVNNKSFNGYGSYITVMEDYGGLFTDAVPLDKKEEKKEIKYQLKIKNISKEIEVNLRTGSILLDNITGPVVAKTGYGNIKAKFTSLHQDSPMSIISNRGDVDLTFPTGSKASFKLTSGRGEIYTDLDLKMSEIKKDNKGRSRFVFPRSSGETNREDREDIIIAEKDELLNYYDLAGGLLSYNYDFMGTLNGGGVEISVRTQNGDVFLRKAN